MASSENLDARHLLEDFVAALRPTDHEPTLDEVRANCERWMTTNMPAPPELVTEPVDAGGVPGLWARMPGTSAERIIFYLHGGAYVVGSAAGWCGFVAALSQAADAKVLLIDYRLAPENPHPAAVDDAVTAYRWLVSSSSPPALITVAGESAGAGLTVAMLIALHDAADDMPAAAVLISPWVDMSLSGASFDERAAHDPFVSRPGLEMNADAYLQGQDAHIPTASPLFADLTGLPPTLILVGTNDALLDDSTRLAHRARDAGGDVTLNVVDEMYHMWPMMHSVLPEARDAVHEFGQFVRTRTGSLVTPSIQAATNL
jgi:monoterpene epsilon-lactone hydrolase